MKNKNNASGNSRESGRLAKYKKKRRFGKTAEPEGGSEKLKSKSAGAALNFVVQKHRASHLHYDFRLEYQGVLLSWAVPKEPSLNPRTKRLAMMVEDHPLEYWNFHGTIPEGNYGAGTVEIWDRGNYVPIAPPERGSAAPEKPATRAESMRIITKGIDKGHLTFILNGKKLKGEFALIKTRFRGGNSWLLIKANDLYAKRGEKIENMRQPIFLGLRADKAPEEVRRRKPETSRSQEKNWLDLKHLDKIFWPAEKFTKGDLIEYYRQTAKYILPYLKDRPQSLNRHPNGIAGKSFFQKDVSALRLPEGIKAKTLRSESEGRTIKYLICQDEDSLLYLANLGCIEINPWNSRIQSPDKPDYAVIDLDPEDAPFANVVSAALAVKKILDAAGVESFCKTSGATGLHIYIPLGAKYNYKEAKEFARFIAVWTNKKLPEITSLERSPAKRKGKIYLDYLQNRRGQTLACAYSVRPLPGAPVSTPLKWNEVKPGLNPKKFTMKNTLARIKKVGDLWKPVLGPGINMEKALFNAKTRGF